MKITSLDYLVLTVADISRSIDFYTRILGMEEITFGEGRKALLFGRQKINLHMRGAEVVPHLCRSEERRVGKECRSRWSPYH